MHPQYLGGNIMLSIGARLTRLMLIISILGMAVVLVVSMLVAGNAILSESVGGIQDATKSEANSMDGWLSSQTEFINTLATDLSFTDDYSAEAIDPQLQAQMAMNESYFDVYVGLPDGTATFATGWVPDYNEWISYERGWYKGAVADPAKPFVTSPYTDAQTGDLCITVSKAILKDGEVAGVAAADMLINILNDIVQQMKVADNSYSFLTDADGNILIHPNEAYAPVDDVFPSLAQVDDGQYADVWSQTSSGGISVKGKEADGKTSYFTAEVVPTTGWLLYSVVPTSVVNAPIYQMLIATIPVFAALVIVAAVLFRNLIAKIASKPMRQISVAAEALSSGEMNVDLPKVYPVLEIKQLSEAFQKMADTTKRQTSSVEHLAQGDLTADVHPMSDKDKMGHALQKVLGSLNDMLHDINGRTAQVTDVSKQIAAGSQSLAQGATEQAATVVELSKTMGEVSTQSQQNTELAQQAAAFANDIKQNAEDGSKKMEQMMQSIQEVSDASRSIEKVMKDIDDIAFQTNILALNAAVEAARAGEHGKGFAVVADEVRNLAAKSAESAKNTAHMIESSIQKSEAGVKIANETVAALMEIVDGINESVRFLMEISDSSANQSSAISQVNDGIDQVSMVVQQNSATAEESAAASEQLTAQAQMLQQLVERFKLKEEGTAPSSYGAEDVPIGFQPEEDMFDDKY